jgi:hypothetical protein
MMSKTLESPDRLYESLVRVAEARGTTPLGWIAARLDEMERGGDDAGASESGAGTMADRFAGRLGRIASGGSDRLSEDTGARLTKHLHEKRSAGCL